MKSPIANNRLSAFAFGGITLILTIIGVILRICNLSLYFDADIGYYSASALLVDIMHIFFACCVLLLGVLSVLIAKKIALENIDDKKDPTAKVILCFLVIGALIYILAKTYFDVYVPMNSSGKILIHMACISAMFFFITQARIYLGLLKPSFYLFSLSATIFLSGTYAIPSIYALTAKIYKGYTYLFFDIAILAVFVFALSKLVIMLTATKPEIIPVSADNRDETTEDTDSSSQNVDQD